MYLSKRIKIFYLLITFFVIVCLGIILSENLKPDPISERAIRAAVSRELDKDPNDLTENDFTKITTLFLRSTTDIDDAKKIFDRRTRKNTQSSGTDNISDKNILDSTILDLLKIMEESMMISDLRFLERLTNLETLNLIDLPFPDVDIPKWKAFLIKLHIIKPYKTIDLDPLKKLKNLKYLMIYNCNIKSIEPVAEVNNLKNLCMSGTNIPNKNDISKLQNIEALIILDTEFRNLKPLEKLKNLKRLRLSNTNTSDLEPLKKLNSLEDLSINNEPIRNFELLNEIESLKKLTLSRLNIVNLSAIKDLKNLQVLGLQEVPVNDLEFIKQIPGIQEVYNKNCYNIKEEQWKELKKSMPGIIITEMGFNFSIKR